MKNRVAIIGGVRTPFVKPNTLFTQLAAYDLGRCVVRELIERTEINPKMVDEVIIGNVLPSLEMTNIGHTISLLSGIPSKGSAFTVNRSCASGLQAITEGYNLIQLGLAHTVIAGGTESISNASLAFPKDFYEFLGDLKKPKTWYEIISKFKHFRLQMIRPQPIIPQIFNDPVTDQNMEESAELLANKFSITRKTQDQFALSSHQRAITASEHHRFSKEIMPVYIPNTSAFQIHDTGPQNNLSNDLLANLPIHMNKKMYGTITSGNRCFLADGAAAVLLMSEEKVKDLGFTPLCWIKSYGYRGIDPRYMALGPIVSTLLALQRAQLTMKDIKLFEIQESFAAQVLAIMRIFEKPHLGEQIGFNISKSTVMNFDNVNVNGGAIALGHAIGSTGTRLILTLAIEMGLRNVDLALATLCIGGGMGGTMILEHT